MFFLKTYFDLRKAVAKGGFSEDQLAELRALLLKAPAQTPPAQQAPATTPLGDDAWRNAWRKVENPSFAPRS